MENSHEELLISKRTILKKINVSFIVHLSW